jgi:5'-methylthioadenosine phosphorylase
MNDVCIGIIGGSGLGDMLADSMDHDAPEQLRLDTPFGSPSSPITIGQVGQVRVAVLQRHGPGHTLMPTHVPYRANIFALKALGCTHLIASGAAGSLREQFLPGEAVICDQLIDRTVARARTFYEHAAVHVEFAEPFCPVMRRWLLQAASSLGDVTVHDGGTYVCVEGPTFSTKAESRMHREWGADLVGMTALPEARLAREAELAYATIALPTDYDCWRPRPEGSDDSSLLEEIIANLQTVSAASLRLIKAAISDVSMLRDTPSPAHDALRLAIWSDKSKIDPEEIERLGVLWKKYFQSDG